MSPEITNRPCPWDGAVAKATLHRERDQDGRLSYIGSWWESWGAGRTLQKYSGLWIIRMGG